MQNNMGNIRGFVSERAFDRGAFLSPSQSYAPIYTWMWNAPVSKEETGRQLAEMARLGIQKFYILPMPKSFRPTSFPTPLEPEYLSEKYLKAYRYALDRAKAIGMQAWLYDEGGWPSGSACGQVMLADPSLVSETIKVIETPCRAGDLYQPTTDAEAAFFEGERVLPGQRIKKNGTLSEYVRVRSSFPHISSADLPDITKKGACELFLALTHEKYAKVFPSFADAGITALFTDEPTAPRPFPYTDEIKDLFLERFHEEITSYLPVLMGKAKATEKSAKIKIEFYDMLSRLFCERFLDREKSWAKEHGLVFLGHLDKDDEANGSVTGGSFGLLRALRRFDIPGVDAIRRQIFPPKGKSGLYGENKFFPRYASSAASQSGGRHALTESFAVYGCGLSYDEMRYILNFQAMRGVNVFNLMIFPYGRKGYLQAGLLPHFTEAAYPDLGTFNDYLKRLSYLFSLGERKVTTALYYPIADGIVGEGFREIAAAYESAGAELEKRRIPFDIVDDDFLQEADGSALARGVFASGRAAYTTIVIPPCKYLSDKSILSLRVFLRGGGKVVALSREIAARIAPETYGSISDLTSPCLLAKSEEVSYAESETADGTLAFLMNEGEERRVLRLPIKGKIPYVISPTDGTVQRPLLKDGGISLELFPGEIVALLYTDLKLPTDDLSEKKQLSLTLRDWRFSLTEKLVFGEDCRRIPLSEEAKPLSSEEMKKGFASDFSGSALYQTAFSLPSDAADVTLDLGKVAGAAEANLNGTSLGVKVMPPYRYKIPLALLRKENRLTIRVTNSAANAFEHTAAFDAFRPWQLGNYIKEEHLLHLDSLEGGLFGEVTLCFTSSTSEE